MFNIEDCTSTHQVYTFDQTVATSPTALHQRAPLSKIERPLHHIQHTHMDVGGHIHAQHCL